MLQLKWQALGVKHEVEFKRMHGNAEGVSHCKIAVFTESQFETLLSFANTISGVIEDNIELIAHPDGCLAKDSMIKSLMTEVCDDELLMRNWLGIVLVIDLEAKHTSKDMEYLWHRIHNKSDIAAQYYAPIIGFRCFMHGDNGLSVALFDNKPYVKTDYMIANSWFEGWSSGR